MDSFTKGFIKGASVSSDTIIDISGAGAGAGLAGGFLVGAADKLPMKGVPIGQKLRAMYESGFMKSPKGALYGGAVGAGLAGLLVPLLMQPDE